MSPQIWTEFSRKLVSRERRRAREDEFYAKVVRDEEERVRNDPNQIVSGMELEAAREEILR
ncbi:hypothetical protein [Candidatus Palauibacter sp.]|uniref:hypothetical protein n=1 Tax=Candidatus Palauibacter sp. TaxID=3101350 RepID=UPI003B518FA1